MSDYNQNDNGIKPISETSSGTSLTTPQSERRSGGYVERVSARIGRDIPPLNMEGISRFANSFGNKNLVHFPISVTSPGFSSLSPCLQSPNISLTLLHRYVTMCLISLILISTRYIY